MSDSSGLEGLGMVIAGIDARCPEVAQSLLDDFRERMSDYAQVAWQYPDADPDDSNGSFIMGRIDGYQESLDGIAEALGVETPAGNYVVRALYEVYGRPYERIPHGGIGMREVMAALARGGLPVTLDRDGFYMEIER